jgi:bifunctional N-acetylglucosamine-1-phosphate-uridyltransferase/glucosamine-1-phosphate-acetyltransferase GlmU-like protein
MQAEDGFRGFTGKVLVACGDAPLISSKSFSALMKEMDDKDAKAVVLTMVHDNPTGYGRMVKDDKGSLIRIVEEKDATQEQKSIKEVNSGTYVFDSGLLFEGLKTIKNDNAQKEYYLPDVLLYIIDKGFRVVTIPLDDPFEGSGINSKEELAAIENVLRNGKVK